MKRLLVVILGGGLVLGTGIVLWSLAHHDHEVTVHDALIAYAVSAPDLSRAEAVLANRCLIRHGAQGAMSARSRPSPWPFTGALPAGSPGSEPEPEPEPEPPALGPDEATLLFGRHDSPGLSATDPSGRTITTSTSGCLAEAREAIYGSIRRFLAVSSMRQWLSERWGEAVVAALGSRRVRPSLAAWEDCADEHGWPSDVTPLEVFDLRALPLLEDPKTPSSWEHERYCRVSSNLMTEIDLALRADPLRDVPGGAPERFVSSVSAAGARAREAIDE